MNTDSVSITLLADEALVLFEWLARADNAEKLCTEYPAEQQVLWKLEGLLEKQVRVFSPDYNQLVQDARAAVEARS
jgi:hypothetical protein